MSRDYKIWVIENKEEIHDPYLSFSNLWDFARRTWDFQQAKITAQKAEIAKKDRQNKLLLDQLKREQAEITAQKKFIESLVNLIISVYSLNIES